MARFTSWLLAAAVTSAASATPAPTTEQDLQHRSPDFENALYPPEGSPEGLYIGSDDLKSWTYFHPSNISLAEPLFEAGTQETTSEKEKEKRGKYTGPLCNQVKVASGSKKKAQDYFASKFTNPFGTRFYGQWIYYVEEGVVAYACNYYGKGSWSDYLYGSDYQTDMRSVDGKCGVGWAGWRNPFDTEGPVAGLANLAADAF
ncbi:hypothetical protein NQ176_g4177 [Zarea fungicola]|uniref:Uncharacterized protein n=1 Tax=Zarea fungicola TaxID=93591 RepID=A0ACC1NH97_9HYPO|nr:hypothetical protein NQ176_g4177 [Lecanicillium fungicola]